MRNSISKFTVIMMAVFLFSESSASAGILFGPYLQSLAPDTMAVCLGVERSDSLSIRIEGANHSVSEAAVGQPACAKFTGLQADVEYHYQLSLNGAPFEFEKSRAFVASTTHELTFVLMGDARAGDDSFDLAHRGIVKAIGENIVADGIIHSGDFVERGNDERLWTNYFRIEADLLANAPIFPAIGQSDQPAETMRRIFPIFRDAPFYSFDRGPAHFVVLNLWRSVSQPSEETSAEGAQSRWLRADLSEARSGGAKYLFAVMHEPAISIDGKIPPAIRDVFMPIFESFRVTAVFSGAHYFSHAVRNGVHYFTNGGGGAVLETQSPAKEAFLFTQATHHFLVLEIDPAGALLRAMNESGAVFYSAALDASPSGPSDRDSPTFVESYNGGTRTVPITVYFREGCGDCEQLKEELPALARDAGLTLVVTYRSLSSAENRARLSSVSGRDTPTPIVSVGEEVFVGAEEIQDHLKGTLISMASGRIAGSSPGKRVIAAGAAILAGLALLLLFLALRRKSHGGKAS